jgi:hypothetical protein
VSVQESAGIGLTVTNAVISFYDNNQNLLNSSAISFSEFFDSCGSGSSRVPPRGSACSDILIGLGGRSSGYVAFLFDGRDDNGTTVRSVSSLQRLAPSSGTALPTTTFEAAGALRSSDRGER